MLEWDLGDLSDLRRTSLCEHLGMLFPLASVCLHLITSHIQKMLSDSVKMLMVSPTPICPLYPSQQEPQTRTGEMESLRSVPSAHMMAHDYPAPGGQMPSSGLVCLEE